MKEFSIIIPTKDRGNIFHTTALHAYKAIQNHNAEIIIVNDSQSNISLPEELNNKENITILDNPIKNSVSRARNFGAKHADSELLIFLDDDIIISKDNINTILDFYNKNSNCLLNLNWVYPQELVKNISQKQFGRFLDYYGFNSLKGWRKNDIWNDNELFEVEFLINNMLPINKTLFIEVGGYNENYPFAGGEDTELSIRLKKLGLKFYINPREYFYHNEADRINLKNWLERKKRGGRTYKVAQELGHPNDYSLNFTEKHKLFLKLIYSTRLFTFTILKIIPNLKLFDKLFFKLVGLLLVAYLYNGYSQKE